MMRISNMRRATLLASALTAAVTFTGIAAGTAPAHAATADAGLFGASDPTYDGVYRQALAIVGLKKAGAPVPPSAVTWLEGQQCLDGSFMAYRASIRTACPAPDPVNYTGPDTNSTALAGMALQAVGRTAAAKRAADVLLKNQNADGGWGYTLGSPSDANSTGLVIAAFDASTKSEIAAERKGRAYLASLAGACRGGASSLPFQKGQAANALASAQALLGLNTGLDLEGSKAEYTKAQRCNEQLDQRVAEYLVAELKKGKGVISSAMEPGKPDYNTTAWTALALVGANRPASEIKAPLRQLLAHAREYVGTGAAVSPAAAGTLALLGEAADGDVRNFGGLNLINVINGTLRK